MPRAPVIHIGGWPGAGKRTIGRLVAERLTGRCIDNHIMLDAARAIYPRGTAGSSALREEVRAVVLRHAEALPRDVPLIFTDALADEPEARPLFQPTVDIAEARQAPLHCFVLDLSIEENVRRLTDPSRTGAAKLKDPEILKSIRAKDRLFVPKDAVVLDISNLSADGAAQAIYEHVGGCNA